MTADEAIALSFISVSILTRGGLAERLRSNHPKILALARSHLDRARVARTEATRLGITPVAWTDSAFPSSLLTLNDFPPALWYRGTVEVLSAPCVAIVGSRAASAGSLEFASGLAADLASLGVVVVSGLARGVDSAAHRGALKTGRTVAVLGSGPDRIYPAEHEMLAQEVSERGAVLSELPPGVPPLQHHFPLRNRLISGLAKVVVVVEANEKSGSLITASCALEQGREVMAVPGNVLGGRNRGAHALIRDGAKIVESADDIVGELGPDLWRSTGGSCHGSADASAHSGDSVASVMEPGIPYDVDDLVARTGLDSPTLLGRLVDLELEGQVRRIDGGRFMRSVRTC
jgi:DNA processing protein